MINGFESKKFPMKNTDVYHDDDDDDDDDFAYGDDLDSGRTLMPDSSTTLPIILHPPLRGSTHKTNTAKIVDTSCTTKSW